MTILLRFSIFIFILLQSGLTPLSAQLDWERQQQLQKYFDNNAKFYGVSKPALEAVLSEHKDFFGNYADALTSVDVLNKLANAQDGNAMKTIMETAGGKLLEGKFPSFASWLGWITWAKSGMELLKGWVIDPYIMSSGLEYYMANRDMGLEPADAVVTIRSWGSVEQQLLAEFRKAYGDSAFESISPSGLKLLPRWQQKFQPYVVSYFEQEAAKFKIKEKAEAERKKLNQNLDAWSAIVLDWLKAEEEKKEQEEKDKKKAEEETKKEEEEEQTQNVTVELALTFPAGQSPNVFTKGWIFGVRAILQPGTAEQRDISEQVTWSGSGNFVPSRGASSRPSFAAAGSNTIQLNLDWNGQTWTKEYKVQAIDPIAEGYASVGSIAACPTDAHGCPACPHAVKGPAINGSPNVTIDGLPALRKGDRGVAVACCGANTFEVIEGDANVLINGQPAARVGHKTKHCGGEGHIVANQFNFPECNENEKLNSSGTQCICKKGYSRNDLDECVKETEEEITGEGEGCGKNEYWQESEQSCACKSAFVRNAAGDCVTPEELAEELAEAEEDNCAALTEAFKGRLAQAKQLKYSYQDHYQSFQAYQQKFYKEINDDAAEFCENRMIAYCYHRAKRSSGSMESAEEELVLLLIDLSYDLAVCEMFETELAAEGLSSNVSTWVNFHQIADEVSAMSNRLSSYGCYPEDVEQFGEAIGIGEDDPNFVSAGGALTEIAGDGKDNDGDGQQDEIPVAGLPGYNITIAVYDSGSAKDDVFNLSIAGRGTLGVTPAGGLRSYGVNLPPGQYTADVSVISAPDNVGTYTINVVENGVSIASLSGSPGNGQVESLTFVVQ